jgi:hypothetical protein
VVGLQLSNLADGLVKIALPPVVVTLTDSRHRHQHRRTRPANIDGTVDMPDDG